MSDRLHLEVVTPTNRVLDLQVDEVRLPGILGEMGILPGHTPVLTSLAVGPLTYTAEGQTRQWVIAGGFAEVLPDRVTVMARFAEGPEAVDAEAARQDLAEAEAALKEAGADDLPALTERVRLAQTRLEVAGVN